MLFRAYILIWFEHYMLIRGDHSTQYRHQRGRSLVVVVIVVSQAESQSFREGLSSYYFDPDIHNNRIVTSKRQDHL